MAQGLKKGTQAPLRHAQAILHSQANFIMPVDATLDWTQAGTIIPITISEETMDNDNDITVSGTTLTLGRGLWRIRMHAAVGTTVATKAFRLAVTNSAGTTVVKQTGDMQAPVLNAGAGGATYGLNTFLTLSAATIVRFRGICITVGGGPAIPGGVEVASVEKIANHDEG